MSTVVESVVLVVGEEEFLRAQAAAAVVEARRAAHPGPEQLTVERVSVTTDGAGAIADALAPALFGGERIVVVADADQATKDVSALLLDYAAHPDPEITLVVLHSGGGRAKALALDLQKTGALVERAPVVKSAEDRVRYVRSEVVAAGGKIDAKAAAALVEALGDDVRGLSSAARQLVADSGGTVTAPTVARYYRGRADVKGFAVADDAVVGRSEAALEKLRWALLDGVPEVVIADALAEGVRTVAAVAAAGRDSPGAIAARLGMPPWKVDRARRQFAGWSASGLATAMRIVATLNASVKGEAFSAQWALEKAVLDVTAARDLT